MRSIGFRDGKYACFAAGLFFFFTIFQKVTFNIIAGSLISQFHFSSAQLGFVSSVYLYANALWLIPGGILLEKFSARVVTLFFMLCCVIASFVIAVSTSAILDSVMRFLCGLGSAMSLLISLRLAANWFPRRSAKVVGFLVSLGMSGGIFANEPFLLLVQKIGWQNGLKMTGMFGLIIFLYMLFTLYDVPTEKIINLKKMMPHFLVIISQWRNWMVSCCIGLMNLPIFVLGALWGNLYLMHAVHFTENQASLIMSMLFIGEISGAPVLGFLSDRFRDQRSVMVSGGVLSLIVLFFIMHPGGMSPALFSLLFFLLGFFLSAQVVGYSIISENNMSFASLANGFCSTMVNFIGACAQIIFPLILMQYSDPIEGYHGAFMIFPVAFLIAVLIGGMLKDSGLFSSKFVNSKAE